MSWLLEQPLAILFVGLVTLAILFGGLVKTGKKWFLFVIAGAAVAFAALLVVEQLVVTPREQVENTIYDIADALEQDDRQAVLRHLSKTNPALLSSARSYMDGLKVEQAKVKSNLTVELRPDQEPPTATARFNAVIVGGDRRGTIRHQRYPRYFVVELVSEDGVWRVYRYEMHEPQRGL